MKRRTFLGGIGATSFGLIGTAAADKKDDLGDRVDVAGVDNKQGLPIEAEGTMLHVYEPLSDQEGVYERRKIFRSPDLERRYGREMLEYESARVVEEVVPETKSAKKKRGSVRVAGRDIETGPDSVVVRNDGVTRVLGTIEEHGTAEKRLRDRAGVSIAGEIDSDDIPLYHYASEDDAEEQRSIFDRQAPINVVWEDWDADSVEDMMEDGVGAGGDEWENTIRVNAIGSLPIVDDNRYAADPNSDTVYSTDEDIQKDDGESCSFPFRNKWSQYHIRAYTFGDSNIGAFGQAHKDPCDHNQDIPGGDTDDPWNYTEAREEVMSDWNERYFTSIEEYDFGNDVGISEPGNTHDGKVAYIKDSWPY